MVWTLAQYEREKERWYSGDAGLQGEMETLEVLGHSETWVYNILKMN